MSFIAYRSNLYEITDEDSNAYYLATSIKELNKIVKKEKIKNLIVINTPAEIGDDFLYGCNSLRTIEFSRPVRPVSSIGEYFMAQCKNLRRVYWDDLLVEVTFIPQGFLSSCERLQKIDLSPLENVECIDGEFLYSCKSLKSIDLEPLTNVTGIGGQFLHDCSGLEAVDLRPLSVKELGPFFLTNCVNIKTLDLTPLKNVSLSEEGLHSKNCSGIERVNSAGVSWYNNPNKTEQQSSYVKHCYENVVMKMMCEADCA